MNVQPSLFGDTPGVNAYGGALARQSDPATSHEAAQAIRPHLADLHKWAVECVRKSPGLTQAELAVLYCATDPRKIGRRLSECEKMGVLRRGPVRACSQTGRSATTWWPVD